MRSIPAALLLVALAAPTLVAGAACAEDRYGPPPSADAADAVPTSYLSWPGKAASTPAAQQVVPAAAAPSNAPQSLYSDAPSPTYRPMGYAPAVYARPAVASVAASPSQPMAPGTVGAPPRFYSVHRQYGIQPDPIALAPQFLAAANSDLAAPPPAPPPRLTAAQSSNLSTAAAAYAARDAAQAEQASSAPAELAGDPNTAN